ncbi:hypothetical protein KNT65_gp184 [Escherichia phage EcS1]|uniref:Uncharacterized 8.8 kDa protein in frd-Gp32 intergenic region n=1 Tax=Escherichia phage EcS1 TaxID=2083276 RepID=A0A2Z5ZCD5_9CAUD|nr:hypothetical protein KNT65_gp184 [Escherichia phage EcS1]BBC78309.1 Hypothetical protein [Escherichia phage EcS1]
MAKVTIDIYDYAYFKETCLDKYNLKEVECVTNGYSMEITIEGDRRTINLYLNREYCVGMYPEMIEELFDTIVESGE